VTDGWTDRRPDDGKDARSILLSRVKIARSAESVEPKNNGPQKTMTENCNTWKITPCNLIRNFVINIQQLITQLRNNTFNKIQWSLLEIIGD